MSEKNSPVRAPLLPYTAVADLIVQLMGKGCEVVLHDLDTPQHSVVYVAGESVTGRKPGQGFRHLVSELIRTPRETPNITPTGFSSTRENRCEAPRFLSATAGGNSRERSA